MVPSNAGLQGINKMLLSIVKISVMFDRRFIHEKIFTERFFVLNP